MTSLTAATPASGGPIAPDQARRPGPSPDSGIALSGGDVVRILRQRLVLILVVWIILSGLGVGFTFFMRVYYPVYRAESLVRVDSVRPKDVTNPLQTELIQEQLIERELQTQALLARSETVLANALKDPDLRRTEWFVEAQEDARDRGEKVEDQLIDILGVSPIRDTNFIRITAGWRVPKEVALIVNTVVQEYLKLIEGHQERSISESKDQLDEELIRTRKLLSAKKEAIDNFRQTRDYSDLSVQAAAQRTLELTAALVELEVEVQGYKSQWESIKSFSAGELPITADLQEILAKDPLIYQLDQALMIAEQNYERYRQSYGEKHQIVRNARIERDAAEARVSEERAVKTLSFQNQMIQQAERNVLEGNEQVVLLQQQVNLAKAEQRDLENKRAEYISMEEEIDILQLQVEKLSEKRDQLEIILRQEQTVQIGVSTKALVPERISSPQLTIWIPAGVLLGLLASVGLAFLLELTDQSVRTSRDVVRTHLPVLGTIPTTDDDEVEIDRVETASLDAPHSIVAEAFRTLRANLFFSAPAEQQGVILITSPSGGNGKTTVATNLAISVALSGRRVLLVDANFRRASLPKIFPNMKPEGLSNILIGQGQLADYVTQTAIPGLDVLSAGPIPPNPAELLGSSYLRDVVVDARVHYDQVLFDGPPVLLVSDAMVLAGAVDGCLLVCEYRRTSRGALQRTQANLQAISARVFGAVLNQVQSRAGGYFRKAYREFYEYNEPDEESDETTATRLEASTVSAATVTAEPGHSEDVDRRGGGGGAATDALDSESIVETPAPIDWEEDAGEGPDAELPDLDDLEDLNIIEDHDLSDRAGQEIADPADSEEGSFPYPPPNETLQDPVDLLADRGEPLTEADQSWTDTNEPQGDTTQPMMDSGEPHPAGGFDGAPPEDLGPPSVETPASDPADLDDDLVDLDGDDFRIDEDFDLDDDTEPPPPDSRS
ncbi:MAG: GumC family protein [Phycisphaerae bacterium]